MHRVATSSTTGLAIAHASAPVALHRVCRTLERRHVCWLIADNRLAELAEADEAALKGVLGELKAANFDLDLAGFDAAALEGLLADPPQPEAPEEFPEIDEDLPTEFRCPKCSYR